MGELKTILFLYCSFAYHSLHSCRYSLSNCWKHLQLEKSSSIMDWNLDYCSLTSLSYLPTLAYLSYFSFTFDGDEGYGWLSLRLFIRLSSSLVVGRSPFFRIITFQQIFKYYTKPTLSNYSFLQVRAYWGNLTRECNLIAVRIYNIIMQIIKSNVDELRKLKPTKFIEQLFSLVIIVGSALALWKGLSVAFYTECPVVVVLSGSMEPGYYRGDILFVTNWNEPIVPGDVVVFSIPGQAIPIVHRVITNQEKADGDSYLLTKGDNNQVDDRGLYNQGNGSMKWIHKRHIMGKMRAYIPYVGFFTIALNDYVWFKYAVLGFMVFCVLIAKDPQN